ncbi:hypothetical protein BY996DRAFT_6552803 [Phakopsora pachyrhizi]|nr:hypothetical protein BY996DRAFT_6552803 [Phakopsora pachyrhizi]
MLEPDYALAVLLFQKFRATSVNSDHIGFFNFCVRVIGKVFNAYFTIAFYKHLLAVGPSTNEKRKLKEVHTSHSDTPVQMTLSFLAPNPMKTPKSQQKRSSNVTNGLAALHVSSSTITVAALTPGDHDHLVKMSVVRLLALTIVPQVPTFKNQFTLLSSHWAFPNSSRIYNQSTPDLLSETSIVTNRFIHPKLFRLPSILPMDFPFKVEKIDSDRYEGEIDIVICGDQESTEEARIRHTLIIITNKFFDTQHAREMFFRYKNNAS